MALNIEWDNNKAHQNAIKHGISFEEAATVFGDPLSLTVDDVLHSTPQELRFITIGIAQTGRLLVLAHCDYGDTIRLISARRATAKERKAYETGTKR